MVFGENVTPVPTILVKPASSYQVKVPPIEAAAVKSDIASPSQYIALTPAGGAGGVDGAETTKIPPIVWQLPSSITT